MLYKYGKRSRKIYFSYVSAKCKKYPKIKRLKYFTSNVEKILIYLERLPSLQLAILLSLSEFSDCFA